MPGKEVTKFTYKFYNVKVYCTVMRNLPWQLLRKFFAWQKDYSFKNFNIPADKNLGTLEQASRTFLSKLFFKFFSSSLFRILRNAEKGYPQFSLFVFFAIAAKLK